jgi:DUF438 domain-containing protein
MIESTLNGLRAQNKYIYFKELNITPVLEKNTGSQEKVDRTCKSNVMQQIMQIDKIKLHPKRQKEPRETTEETCGCVRPERVNK